MNFLSIFVLIPLLMILALWASRSIKQIKTIMVVGSSLLLALAAYSACLYAQVRAAGDTSPMLFAKSIEWYTPLNICYTVGVDGISIVMLLLASIIVFTGVFASWKMKM